MRRILQLEALEDRSLLSAGVALAVPTDPIFLGPPIRIEPDFQVETEPNDSLADANALSLSPGYPWRIYPLEPIYHIAGDAAADANSDGAIGSSFLPYPWPYRQFQFGSISGALSNSETASDVDSFSFSSEAQRKITITLTGSALRDGAVPVLLDADGNPVEGVEANQHGDDDALYAVTLEVYTNEGGDFFIQVGPTGEANTDGAAEYTLQVTVAPDPTNEHEPNDSLETANPLQLNFYPIYWLNAYPAAEVSPVETGGSVDVSVAWPIWNPWPYQSRQTGFVSGSLDGTEGSADVDYFSFAARGEHKITLSMDGDAVSAGALLELLDGEGNVLASAQAIDAISEGGLGWISLDYYSREGGKFFVRVSAATGDYTVHATVATDPYVEHEPNDGFDSANSILMSLGYPLYYPDGVHDMSARLLDPDIRWRRGEQNGFISGQIDSTSDQDYFSFTAHDSRILDVELHGALAENGGRITLYDANQQELASGDGALSWTVKEGGTFYVRVDRPDAGSSEDSSASDYQIDVTTKPMVNPIEGPDEQEPNNTFEQANPLYLDWFFHDDSVLSVRTGSAVGIAGGETHDQDVYQFDLYTGERVHVGLLCAGADGVTVSVFDAAGNQVARSDEEGLRGLVFEVESDGSYYAVVSPASAESTALVRYRLSVFASGCETIDETVSNTETEVPVEDVPIEVELDAGERFEYVDADGDMVRLVFKGGRGTATIAFTGSDPNGSDIASIVVEGVRGGKLFVRTEGSAEVGVIDINGLVRNGRVVGRFGEVSVDGNLGSMTTDIDLVRVNVEGLLGELSAAGQQIDRLMAETFDPALALAEGIRKLVVENDLNAEALAGFFEDLSDQLPLPGVEIPRCPPDPVHEILSRGSIRRGQRWR